MLLDEAFDIVNMPVLMQERLKACYTQKHRHYHNLDHLEEILKWVPEDHSEIEILLEAILFHDLVYFPTAVALGLNEALSIAEYLSYNTKAMAFNIPFSKSDASFEYERLVIEAINATTHHLEDQLYLGTTSKLMLDLDLSTFALPWEEYLVWKTRVEMENLEVWKDTYQVEDIQRGRCLFLQKLNKRQQLYYVKTEWEQQARANIQQDIEMSKFN